MAESWGNKKNRPTPSKRYSLAESLFDVADRNADAALTRDEYRAAYDGRRSVAQIRTAFEKHDKNGDGQIARIEFVGSQ